jgi:hypothetical protein
MPDSYYCNRLRIFLESWPLRSAEELPSLFRARYVTPEAEPAADDDCRSSDQTPEQRRRLYLSFRMEPKV